jgi:hypothetical protein
MEEGITPHRLTTPLDDRIMAPGPIGSSAYGNLVSIFRRCRRAGWALPVAWGIIRYGTGRARWAAVAYPVATTSVVVLTANHYWLDGMVGAVVVIVSIALSGRVERIVSRRGAQGA